MKRKRTRIASALVVCCLLCMTILSGCIRVRTGSPDDTTRATGSTTAKSGDTQKPGTEETTRSTTRETAAQGNDATFEEVTIAENEACKVVVTSFSIDELWGPTFNLYLENNSDKTLMFSIEDASVNGFMCDPFWAEEVAPGKKANSDAAWSESALEEDGINYVAEVEFTLRVYDSNDWMADDIVDVPVTLSVSNSTEDPPVDAVEYADGFTEQPLVATESVVVTAKTFQPDGDWGQTLILYLENNTDKNLMYSMDEVSVNGFMCDPFWATGVSAGKKEYSGVSWSESTLGENAITEIQEIEFRLRVYDSDDYMAEDYFDEMVRVVVGNG